MKKIDRILLLGWMMISASVSVYAQKDRTQSIIRSSLIGLEYEIKAGLSIGGTAPIPLPAEIRSIEKYTPTLSTSIEGNATKWLGSKWGVQVGIRLENKGMKTDAKVKNYKMEMIGKEGGHMKGMWTGCVQTKVDNSYLSMPLLAVYKLSSRWKLKGGAFVAYMTEGEFSGSAYDGYLRDEDPIGANAFVSEASYDFSEDLRNFSWGLQLSADWRAFKHLSVYADLTWGLNNIFKKDFETITFAMYPIYLNIGFGYAF